MDYPYWQKQDPSKPLFEDLIWSKPQQKNLSGKLLIVGGNAHAIGAPVAAYEAAIKQGVGDCQVILPNATKKLFGPKPPPQILFVSSTGSGSFSQSATNELKSYYAWADGVLLAGDFGHNSETTILLETLCSIPKLQVFCGDGVDNLMIAPQTLLQNQQAALVVTIAQLQKLVAAIKYPRAIKQDMPLLQLVEFMHDFSKILPCHIVVDHQQEIVVASGGQIVSTKLVGANHVKLAATAAVWWLQNPAKTLQALATATTQI